MIGGQADIYLDWIDKMGDRLDKVEEMESQHNVSVLNEKAAELRVRDNLADPLLPVCGILQSSHEYCNILIQKGNCNKIHNLLAGFCHAQRLELTGHQVTDRTHMSPSVIISMVRASHWSSDDYKLYTYVTFALPS